VHRLKKTLTHHDPPSQGNALPGDSLRLLAYQVARPAVGPLSPAHVMQITWRKIRLVSQTQGSQDRLLFGD
jgi:hypothetical protein